MRGTTAPSINWFVVIASKNVDVMETVGNGNLNTNSALRNGNELAKIVQEGNVYYVSNDAATEYH